MSLEKSSGNNFAVKDIAKFPIPLAPLMRTWDANNTLRPRLLSVIALAIEIDSGEVVRYGSAMHEELEAFLNVIMPKKELPR